MATTAYTTRAKVEAKIPPAFVLEALDDDGDATEDTGVFDTVVDTAGDEIEGYLEGRYALPLATVPTLLKNAGLIFTCESLYERRGYVSENNPWHGRANRMRDQLEAIRDGDAALDVDIDEGNTQISVITEPARTHSTGGRLLT